jgi:hypothetical protein
MKSLGLCLLVVSGAASSVAAATGKFDPCSLLTRREIEEVQGDRLASQKGSEPQRERFAVSQCFYTLATFSKSISLEVTRGRPGETESPRAYWKQMFFRAMEKGKEKEDEAESGERAREKAREAAARPRRISGVGDEAFWDGSTLGGGLFVLKGDAYFRLSVGGPDNETVKIEKLKKLARRALPRLS